MDTFHALVTAAIASSLIVTAFVLLAVIADHFGSED
jgi:hypothetical protein